MIGIDAPGIGSNKWNMKETIKGWRQGIALGLFDDNTFGPKAFSNMQRLVQTDMVPAIRPHLNWAGPNAKHILPPPQKIKAAAPKYEKFQKANPGIRVYVSPTCEFDSQDKKAIKAMLDLTASLCPSCTIVQNPSGKGATVPGYLVERHGKTVVGPGQIISYDGGVKGEGLFDIDATKWFRDNSQAEIAFGWGPLLNMAEAHNTTPPNLRDDTPPAGYITSLIRLADPVGTPPTASFPVIPLKKPFLYKSHAEDSQGKDPRNNKPMFIAKPKTGSIELVTFQGATVCKFPYAPNVGPFPPDLFRWYSGNAGGPNLWGWQIADKAQQMSGSPFVCIKLAGKFYGWIHPAHRTPFYQA